MAIKTLETFTAKEMVAVQMALEKQKEDMETVLEENKVSNLYNAEGVKHIENILKHIISVLIKVSNSTEIPPTSLKATDVTDEDIAEFTNKKK